MKLKLELTNCYGICQLSKVDWSALDPKFLMKECKHI